MFQSIKALEIYNSLLFNLVFADITILSHFFLFLLITDLHLLIAAVITQMFNRIAAPTKLVSPYRNTN